MSMRASRPPPRVLIVESHAALAVAIAAVLVESGMAVEVASSFEAAVEAIQRKLFDVIVSAPLLGGEAPFGRVPELRRRAMPTPVGLMTGQAIEPREATARGLAFMLAKPFRGEELLAAIADAIGSQVSAERPEVGVIHSYFAALSRHDWSALVSLCSPDVVYYLPVPGPLGRMVTGREALRACAIETFAGFPGVTFEERVIYDLGHALIARYRSSWRGSDGEPIEMAGAVLFRIEDGLITRIGVEIDHERLARLMRPEA